LIRNFGAGNGVIVHFIDLYELFTVFAKDLKHVASGSLIFGMILLIICGHIIWISSGLIMNNLIGLISRNCLFLLGDKQLLKVSQFFGENGLFIVKTGW